MVKKTDKKAAKTTLDEVVAQAELEAKAKAEAEAKAKADAEELAKQKAQAKKGKPGIRVVSARDGFRRAGLQFFKAPTEIALADITDAQLAAIHAEPMFTVTPIDIKTAQ